MTDDTILDEAKVPSRELVQRSDESGLPAPYDPLKKYLSEVSRYPVLSKDEEVELASRVFNDKDRAAAEKLVISNLRLVVKIALEY